MQPRKHYDIPLLNHHALRLGERTLVMGIINVTPDSFADGGLRFDEGRAVEDGLKLIEEGADLLDVGGESTRPGAEPLPEVEELRRVVRVIERLVRFGRVPVSVDTYKAGVAREAVAAGATIVNDVSCLQYDPDLASTIAETGAAVVLMHNRGRSRDMYKKALYRDVTAEIVEELEEAIAVAAAAGVRRELILVDPGLGFGKRAEHTYAALARMDALRVLDRPIVSGPSRKSFLKVAIGETLPSDREWGTAAAVAASVLSGAHVVRVHGVRAMVDVARVSDRIRAAAEGQG